MNPDVAFELYENAQTPKEDKEIVFYKDMWHDIWNEEEIFEIMEISLKWMLGRVEKKNGMKNEWSFWSIYEQYRWIISIYHSSYLYH